MIPELPPQELDCPDPVQCPVALDELGTLAATGALTLARFPQATRWHRVYDARNGHSHANPGYGDTRFAPFDARHSGRRVPTLYVAQSLGAALLETSLHDIHETTPRVVAEMALLGKLHARFFAPRDLTLIDLRDEQLSHMGLARERISSSAAELYPCTRRVARDLHSRCGLADGITWHSRQAELTKGAPAEITAVFCDRVPTLRKSWRPAEQGAQSLLGIEFDCLIDLGRCCRRLGSASNAGFGRQTDCEEPFAAVLDILHEASRASVSRASTLLR